MELSLDLLADITLIIIVIAFIVKRFTRGGRGGRTRNVRGNNQRSIRNIGGSSYTITYLASDNNPVADRIYRFKIQKVVNGYRIYILRSPSYRGRSTNAHATHRHSDGSRYWVCWTNPIRTKRDAENIAKAWAEGTQNYINTGRTF